MPKKKETVTVQGTEVAVLTHRQDDYISLTDMAKFKNAEIPGTVISHWMSTVFSINYMGLWEKMNNPDFNLTGFSDVKTSLAETGFALSPKQWIARTNALGIVSKSGRYVNQLNPRPLFRLELLELGTRHRNTAQPKPGTSAETVAITRK